MKVAQNMRSLLAAKKRNRIDYCAQNAQTHDLLSKSSAEGWREKSDPEKYGKTKKEEKKTCSVPTPWTALMPTGGGPVDYTEAE